MPEPENDMAERVALTLFWSYERIDPSGEVSQAEWHEKWMKAWPPA
jgi:hypothetical protein